MPAAARQGDTVNTGHGCDGTTTIQGPCSPNVNIGGKPAARMGDLLAAHQITNPAPSPPNPPCIPHPGQKINAGSSTVLINGLKAARVGDSADSGSISGAGAPTVIIGG